MAERVTVSDMMDAREARAQAQRALLARYPGASVVCLCMNIAGAIKRTENIERAFAWGLRNVKAVLAPCETLFDAAIHEKTGPEAMLCVRADARAIKRRLCALEDGEALGRLLDIDVIAPNGGKISRTEIGLPARRCLLCGNPAPVCARSRAHSADALFEKANAIIDAHFEAAFAKRTAENAQRALLFEVAVTPKPGARTETWTSSHSSTARARSGRISKPARVSALRTGEKTRRRALTRCAYRGFWRRTPCAARRAA